jgi:putative transposase
MSTRKQSFAPGEFYHLYNRGTDKRIIFHEDHDYQHFLFLMRICNTFKNIEMRKISRFFDPGEPIIAIGAYCLMPNHFHILAYEKTDGGISKYMLKLLTAYSMYFNTKYKRTGKLYEGVFKSTHADTGTYLKYLYSYIHLNPAKLIDSKWRDNKNRDTSKLMEYAFSYPYSSLKEYKTSHYTILEPSTFPPYFKTIHDHKKELFEWLTIDSQ